MSDYVPDESDFMDAAASDARDAHWAGWEESKWADPLSPEEREVADAAHFDAWAAGLAWGRKESEQTIAGLSRNVREALDVAENNRRSAERALELYRD